MTGHEDDPLLGELRSLLARTDPVPAEVTEFAQAALGWRRLDAELAELLADSALETEAVTRGDGDARWLTFRAAELTLDVQVQAAGDGYVLLGRLEPPSAATIEVQAADGDVVAQADADAEGRFRLTLAGGGRIRLRIALDGAAPVETSWLAL